MARLDTTQEADVDAGAARQRQARGSPGPYFAGAAVFFFASILFLK